MKKIISNAAYDCYEYEEWYLHTEDKVQLYVKEFGQGKDPVIVVHGGFGANQNYMWKAVEGLENDFHFIFYDQRGSLLSPCDPAKISLDKHVEDLKSLIEELKIEKAKIFCHSMGTRIGMEFINKYPEKVVNLVLVGSLFSKVETARDIFNERMQEQGEYLIARDEVQKLLAAYKDEALLSAKEKTEKWRIEFSALNLFDMSKIREMQGAGGVFYSQEAGSAVQQNGISWEYDYRDILNDGKATIIMGEYDYLDFNGKIHQEQLKNYPNVAVKVIKNSCHNIWLDNPEVFRDELKRALVR